MGKSCAAIGGLQRGETLVEIWGRREFLQISTADLEHPFSNTGIIQELSISVLLISSSSEECIR